eukprot:scaffold257_cov241-Pinguiococcus_pyrenoidosus.AAC.9
MAFRLKGKFESSKCTCCLQRIARGALPLSRSSPTDAGPGELVDQATGISWPVKVRCPAPASPETFCSGAHAFGGFKTHLRLLRVDAGSSRQEDDPPWHRRSGKELRRGQRERVLRSTLRAPQGQGGCHAGVVGAVSRARNDAASFPRLHSAT